MSREISSRGRKSGVDLLKIIAMFLVVLSHVTGTMCSQSFGYPEEYVINITDSTTNMQNLVLSWISYSGSLGNLCFFTCTAWFLLDSKKFNINKPVRMLANMWVINVIVLVAAELTGIFDISIRAVIKSLVPIMFDLNWYITCYVLFYFIHPVLNKFIHSLSQKQLLTYSAVMFCLYFLSNCLKKELFYTSKLIIFIVMYFIIAYIKQYLPRLSKSRIANIIGLIFGLGAPFALNVATSYLGFRYEFLSTRVLHWGGNGSPFLLIAALSLFNLLYNTNFKNRAVNYVSSLSMLVYLFHEQYIIQIYVRPYIYIYIRENTTYSNFVLMDLLLAVALFLITLAVSMLYRAVLQPLVDKASDKLLAVIKKVYGKACNVLMRIK